MDHLRSADAIVGSIAIGLQEAFVVTKKTQWPFTFAPRAEVEDGTANRSSILPEVGLLVLAAAIAHLHIHRRFVRLNITSTE